MKNIFFYDTVIGKLGIAEDGTGITNIFINETGLPEGSIVKETPRIKKAMTQLAEYFSGKRRSFDVPLALYGTDFQKSVWQALLTIPYGETRTYKQIALAIGKPKGSRAVGMANHKNPVPLLVPCHRVIGSNGKLVGYAFGTEMKEKLIRLESHSEG